MSATRFAGESCVTASMAQVDFSRPVPVGDIAMAEAFVYDVGLTSARVWVKVHREDPETAEREPTTESFMGFVAIDEDREPTSVPEFTVSMEEGERIRREAWAGENGTGR